MAKNSPLLLPHGTQKPAVQAYEKPEHKSGNSKQASGAQSFRFEHPIICGEGCGKLCM